jgi:hypothetical protein
MSFKGFTFDREKLEILLEYWERGQMSQEHALELKRLLEPLHKRAIDMGDIDLEKKTENILISLKRFIGKISLLEDIPVNHQVDVKKIIDKY